MRRYLTAVFATLLLLPLDAAAQDDVPSDARAFFVALLTTFEERTVESHADCRASLEGWTEPYLTLPCTRYVGNAKVYFQTVEGALSGWGYFVGTEALVGRTETDLTADYDALRADYDALVSQYGIYRGYTHSGPPPFSG